MQSMNGGWDHLIDPFTGETLPGPLQLRMDELRHMVKDHMGHPFDALFGKSLGDDLTSWMKEEKTRYLDFPPEWLLLARAILHREVAASLRRRWVMGCEVVGKPYRKLMPVLACGATVPLGVGNQVWAISAYFHTGSLRDDDGERGERAEARWRQGAAKHLVTEHCPREADLKRRYPAPGAWKDTCHAVRGREVRTNLRYANHPFFGWESDVPGSVWTERPNVVLH